MLYKLVNTIPTVRYPLFGAVTSRWFAVQQFKLPDIGEGIAEVQIMEWFVKEGDRVKEMDKLCLVESDKASVEISSRYEGVVKSICIPANQHAKVGSVIVEIDDEKEGDVATDKPPKEVTKAPTKPPPAAPRSETTIKSTSDSIKATPAVRALAKQLGVDLSSIKGTGTDGRITETDVRNSQGQKAQIPKSQPVSFNTQLESFGPSKEVKLSQVGIAMVKSMNESLHVPQLNHADEIEVDRLVDMIKALKPLAHSRFHLPSLTVTAFFVKAVSIGMEAYPIINSRLSPGQDSYHLIQAHNVSVAMDSPRGLVVPNIKNVHQKSIVEIQKDLVDLQHRAKSGRLSLDDIRGGTVSFSNIGVIGGTYAKPVIFDGQAVIGAVGRIQQLPRYKDGSLVPKKIVNVSWTADHRHVDGASVARFSNVFKSVVEEPEEIIALHFK
jgi:2-oxoisovalerate dehydrogenase E2 component (dihydrolipoyl transacylase)